MLNRTQKGASVLEKKRGGVRVHARIKERFHTVQEKLITEENVLLLQKGKRGVLNVLFGRTAIIVVLILLQFGMMFSVSRWLGEYVPEFYSFILLASVIIGIHVLNKPGDPTVKLTWIIIIMAAPFFGALLYMWIQNDIGHRILHSRLDGILDRTKNYLNTDEELKAHLKNQHHDLYELSVYMDRVGGYPVYQGCPVTYFKSGEEKFEDLLVELEKAREFIFLEYFIIEEGYMWGRILEILSRKAKEGVEVRVLYDGTCSLYKVPYGYAKKIRSLGIQCKMFAPLRPTVSTHYNNRDHRKILVIDGHVAYTGGINLADEYINRKKLYGHWKDTAVKVEGAAVKSFTLMFLQMWNVDERVELYDTYVNREYEILPPPKGYVIPYGDSPLDHERVGEMVYFDILNRAEKHVHIMTPYLILNQEMLTALTFAAKRGVEVQLILPHQPDKEAAFALAKTYYAQLLKAGVEIYEYLPGFVHAKIFTSDNRKAVVGTINLDYRSLQHHFECGLYMYDVEAISVMERDFIDTRAKCKKITMADVRRDKITRRILGPLLKVVAPLM